MRYNLHDAIEDAGSVSQTALNLGHSQHQEINAIFHGLGNPLGQNTKTNNNPFHV